MDGEIQAPLDSNTTWTCERCGERVKVGTGGRGNMENHQNAPTCINATKAKANKASSMAIFQRWSASGPPKEVTPKVSSQMPAPLVQPKKIRPLGVIKAVTDSRTDNSPAVMAPAASAVPKLLLELENAIARLPNSVPLGIPADKTAVAFRLDSYPSSVPKDEAWETLDPIFNNILGMSVSPKRISEWIRRGPYGIEAVYGWIKKSITGHHQIAVSLYEGKIKNLMDGINLLYVHG